MKLLIVIAILLGCSGFIFFLVSLIAEWDWYAMLAIRYLYFPACYEARCLAAHIDNYPDDWAPKKEYSKSLIVNRELKIQIGFYSSSGSGLGVRQGGQEWELNAVEKRIIWSVVKKYKQADVKEKLATSLVDDVKGKTK